MSNPATDTPNEILIFQIGNVRLGLASGHVQGVIRAVTLTPLPGAPPTIEGVLNLRGRVVPVLNMRRLLQLGDKAIEHTDHLIIVETPRGLLAIRADRAIDLCRLDDADVQASADQQLESPYISHTAKTPDGLVHLLRTDRFLSATQAAELHTAVTDSPTKEPPP